MIDRGLRFRVERKEAVAAARVQGNALKWAGSLACAYINNIRQYRIKIRIFLGSNNGPWCPNKGNARRNGSGGGGGGSIGGGGGGIYKSNKTVEQQLSEVSSGEGRKRGRGRWKVERVRERDTGGR